MEQILSFGTADWPENEELKGDLIWVAAKNALMAGYHYVTLINIVSGLYYATHLLTQNS